MTLEVLGIIGVFVLAILAAGAMALFFGLNFWWMLLAFGFCAGFGLMLGMSL